MLICFVLFYVLVCVCDCSFLFSEVFCVISAFLKCLNGCFCVVLCLLSCRDVCFCFLAEDVKGAPGGLCFSQVLAS